MGEPRQMTPEQEHEFCSYAIFGTSLGLGHRYEWYVNAIGSLSFCDWTKISEREEVIAGTFLAFEKQLASCPEEKEEYDSMTLEDYDKRVDAWYHRPKHSLVLSS